LQAEKSLAQAFEITGILLAPHHPPEIKGPPGKHIKEASHSFEAVDF
jgi:hypothetical protein